MKELKPSTKLDGTPEENERAIQRIIDSLSEEKQNQCQINTHTLTKIKSTFLDVLFCMQEKSEFLL